VKGRAGRGGGANSERRELAYEPWMVRLGAWDR